MIRLAIAAPSAVVRAGLEALAASSPELQLVGSFPDVASADDLRPDVILASLTLGGDRDRARRRHGGHRAAHE